jgi:hypothetical protein
MELLASLLENLGGYRMVSPAQREVSEELRPKTAKGQSKRRRVAALETTRLRDCGSAGLELQTAA